LLSSFVVGLKILAIGTNIVVEYRAFCVWVMVFCQNHLFLGIGAAYGRTITVIALSNPSGTDALNPGYFMRMLLVGSPQYLAFVWSGGAQQPLKVKTGYHVLKFAVAIVAFYLRVKRFKTRRQNDCPYFYFYLLRRLIEVYGVVLTYSFANAAFLLFEVKATFINIRDEGNRLCKVYMDGFVLRYFLVKSIRVLDRAVLNAGGAACAFILYNVSGLSDQSYRKVSCFPFYTANFSVRQNFYVWVPADLDQLG